jgi:exopolyphosphatase / guanosine-5'-triphosphate,3'-diphosphate pyrophosphatase
VVDIGSNSVRLVVYDGRRRAPSPVFNEKILCGLGRGVALTGELATGPMDRALAALQRFRALCRQIEVTHTIAVATAAVREASNGHDFVARAERALGAPITVLTGSKEAEMTALGVISGIPARRRRGRRSRRRQPGACGGEPGQDPRRHHCHWVPCGSSTCQEARSRTPDRSSTRRSTLRAARPVERPRLLRGRRRLAQSGPHAHGAECPSADHSAPLHGAPRGLPLRRQSGGGLSPTSLHAIRAVARSRAETLPYGAMVLERILARAKARSVVVSVFGVREGLMIYASLKKGQARRRPAAVGVLGFRPPLCPLAGPRA